MNLVNVLGPILLAGLMIIFTVGGLQSEQETRLEKASCKEKGLVYQKLEGGEVVCIVGIRP